MAHKTREKEIAEKFKIKDPIFDIYSDTDGWNSDFECLDWDTIYNIFYNNEFSQFGEDTQVYNNVMPCFPSRGIEFVIF